jgi:hypothetical protein
MLDITRTRKRNVDGLSVLGLERNGKKYRQQQNGGTDSVLHDVSPKKAFAFDRS